MKNIVIAILASIGLTHTYLAHAQTQQPQDPAGYITKYDVSFDGIGPAVYFLPAPLPRIEDLYLQFTKTTSFVDSITDQLAQNQRKETYRFVGPSPDSVSKGSLQTESKLVYEALIQEAIAIGNPLLFYSTTNRYAHYLLSTGDTEAAITELHKALLSAEQTKNSTDIQLLQQNLIELLISVGKYQEAKQVAQAQLQWGIKDKNQAAQGYSLLNQARILGLEKAYQEAENMIIRKTFPLFNRSKNKEGKARALTTLAEIYRAQHKLTEAQWFLLQARDLAHENNSHRDIASIEYLLGVSKFEQENYTVAQKELQAALQYAKIQDNKHLQLIILDRLGRIALIQNDLISANEQLKDYWKLRREIF